MTEPIPSREDIRQQADVVRDSQRHVDELLARAEDPVTHNRPTSAAERSSRARNPLGESRAPSGALSEPHTGTEPSDCPRCVHDERTRGVIQLSAFELYPPDHAPECRAGLRDRIAEVLWPLTDWDGDRLNAERAADAVLALLPPVAPCSCRDNPALTAAIGYPVRCPHCPPGTAIPPTDWAEHVQRHHPEVPPAVPHAAEVRAATLNEAEQALRAKAVHAEDGCDFCIGVDWAADQLRALHAATARPDDAGT